MRDRVLLTLSLLSGMILQAGCDRAFWHFWHRIFIIEALPNPCVFPRTSQFFPRTSQNFPVFSQVPSQTDPSPPFCRCHGQDLNRPSLERRHLRHVGLGQRPGGPVAVPSGGGAAGSHGGVCLQPADAVNQRALWVTWADLGWKGSGWPWGWVLSWNIFLTFR